MTKNEIALNLALGILEKNNPILTSYTTPEEVGKHVAEFYNTIYETLNVPEE